MFVGHSAEDVAFGVLELGEDADGRDRRLRHDDAPVMFRDGVGDRVEVVHGDGAFEAIRAADAARLLALVQQSQHARLALVARVHEIEIRRSPRLEAPAEDRFVEAAAALDIVGVDM